MRTIVVFATASLILNSPLAAQAPQQPKPITRSEFMTQLNSGFAAMDTNHDGFLSPAEIQAAQENDRQKVQAAARAKLAAEFKQLDTNHDGQLSLQEFEAIAVVRANATPQQIFQQFDTNHDGKVSAAEFKAPRMQQFDRADTNHDGVVTPAEAAATQGH